ncbi:MAG TPA: TMEM165/GDT1 family protein, partial [Acidimicrobiales bacterium]
RGEDDDEAVDPAARRSGLAAAAAVAATFFASEIGDKTMLATAALAARQGAVPTWAGATLGMVTADAAAIVVGRRLAARLSSRTIRLASAAVFALFGVLLVLQALL